MVERLGKGDQIDVWLFVVDPGHLRVLSASEVAKLIDLDEFNRADALAFETQEERDRLVALHMRLIQSAIVPDKRLKIPAEAFDVCGEYLDRTHVWLQQSSTYLDVYTATYVQKVLAIRPSEFLPTAFQRK
jgi:hypothetical protein